MSETIKGFTRSGKEWIPQFLESVDQNNCIGCGRCYKVCGRSVMAPVAVMNEDDDDSRTVLAVLDQGDCIGCGSCAKVCTKGCHTFATASI